MTRQRACEDAIQRQIIQYFSAVVPRGMIFAVPNASLRTRHGRASNAVSGLMRGVPDLCAMLPGGRTLWLEVKTEKGRASEHQIAFHGKMMALGHVCAVVRSVDDVRRTLKVLQIETREHVAS